MIYFLFLNIESPFLFFSCNSRFSFLLSRHPSYVLPSLPPSLLCFRSLPSFSSCFLLISPCRSLPFFSISSSTVSYQFSQIPTSIPHHTNFIKSNSSLLRLVSSFPFFAAVSPYCIPPLPSLFFACSSLFLKSFQSLAT